MTDILTSKIELTAPGRPCWVARPRRNAPGGLERKKAFLHLITTRAYVVEPSILKGGHPGGQVSKPVAVVEFENGELYTVDIEYVQLLDSADCFNFTDEPSPWDEDEGEDEE